MKREEIGNRLRAAREAAGLSRDHVVANHSVNISRTTLQQWENGTTEASIETIEKLARLYGTSPHSIIFGDSKAAPVSTEPTSNLDTEDYALVPAYDIEASAGHGSFVAGEQAHKHLAFRARWLNARGLRAKDLAVLFTKGDSMEPTIPDGAALVIDRKRHRALDGKVYVIRIEDRLYVKRTQWVPTGGLRLISDNKLYDPFDITKEQLLSENIEVCGQVIHASYDLPD